MRPLGIFLRGRFLFVTINSKLAKSQKEIIENPLASHSFDHLRIYNSKIQQNLPRGHFRPY